MKNYLLISCLMIATIQADHTISLTEDLHISGQLSSEQDKLTISSDNGHSIVVNTTWDLTKEASLIEITGNARLVIESGAKIIGNGGTVRFKDDAQCIIKE